MRLRSRTFGVVLALASTFGLTTLIAPAGAASVPSAPAMPGAAPGNAQVRVTWKTPASNGAAITGYVVTPFLGSVAQPSMTFNSTAVTELVTGLKNAKRYTFKVAARNAVGTGARSAGSNPVMPTSNPTLGIATNPTIGKQILVSASGITLYLFVPDGNSKISKVPAGAIKAAWPAVVWASHPTVGAGLNKAKAALDVQPDGKPQVAYNGHLLYSFVSDTKPGDASGQGVANFFVVSPAGNRIP